MQEKRHLCAAIWMQEKFEVKAINSQEEWEEYLDMLASRADHGVLQRVTRLNSVETMSSGIWHGSRLSH